MPGLSIHVVDVAHGSVAAGMHVALLDPRANRVIAAGEINGSGLLAHPALAGRFEPGVYEARFHVAEFYRRRGTALPREPFLDVVPFRFGIDDPEQHYHLPFKCTPWGFSCFRGGA